MRKESESEVVTEVEAYVVDFGFARLIAHMPLSDDEQRAVNAMTQAASEAVVDWWYVSKKEAA